MSTLTISARRALEIVEALGQAKLGRGNDQAKGQIHAPLAASLAKAGRLRIVDGVATLATAHAEPAKPPADERKAMLRRKRKTRPAKAPKAPDASTEDAKVAAARKKIRALIDSATADTPPKAAIGLVLALVNQETGHHAAANLLIDEYGLEKLGITKVQ